VTGSANLDLVRSIYADWERGDYKSAEWADPGIEYTLDEFGVFSRESWKGLVGMAQGARARIEVIKDFRLQAQEYRELDDNRVLVVDRRTGRMKHSGIELPSVGAHLFNIHRGRVTRLIAYHDRERALADLGLER
jgi:hypothetical protein